MISLQNGDDRAVMVERATCSYKNLSHKFIFEKKRDFKAQYAHIYYTRLQKMRKSLEDSAKQKWGKLFHLHNNYTLRLDHVRSICFQET